MHADTYSLIGAPTGAHTGGDPSAAGAWEAGECEASSCHFPCLQMPNCALYCTCRLMYASRRSSPGEPQAERDAMRTVSGVGHGTGAQPGPQAGVSVSRTWGVLCKAKSFRGGPLSPSGISSTRGKRPGEHLQSGDACLRTGTTPGTSSEARRLTQSRHSPAASPINAHTEHLDSAHLTQLLHLFLLPVSLFERATHLH